MKNQHESTRINVESVQLRINVVKGDFVPNPQHASTLNTPPPCKGGVSVMLLLILRTEGEGRKNDASDRNSDRK